MTTKATAGRSTAEAQRRRITTCAVAVFARTGYHATPVTEVAEAAEVSPAYIFRLFPGKLGLFVAAVEHCYSRVATVLTEAGERASAAGPRERLEAMTAAYVELIADRDLIMLQAHAQSACEVPEIRSAVRRGLAGVVTAVTNVSGAPDAAVQRFIAYGQLCHLIVQTDLDGEPASWARTLTAGIAHPA
ncbi:TetR/AcrR family transcriptional regulator [Nakamurella flavida]|uniref:TetR/AcrR family transcriptional regulator n=1 Tax=Nakamurella flavida TaxID=363630 RepID=A0A938YKY6_9ACTN|nr:TetR/AcrR family transcriptional regulator [Nakamurella flavida]MBM9477907.1 TetR/AcrR family transcriptional regulator [Nakamurella flavida]MDP9778378.1 AcrR family transcriptional regulator [Nakamurella flavida]